MLASILSLALVAAPAADGGPASIDAGPLTLSLTQTDGGSIDLDGGVPSDVDLLVELAPRLEGFRLRVLDSSGRQLPATEDVRLADQTQVTVHVDPPLQPGSRYVVVLEPATSEPMRDNLGRTYGSSQLELRTSGEPPARKAKPGHRTKRRRR